MTHSPRTLFRFIWISLLSSISIGALAEDSVHLSFTYFPESDYRMESVTNSQIKMNFSGDYTALPIDLAQRLPMDFEMMQQTAHTLKTGKTKPDNTFSISMKLGDEKTQIKMPGQEFMELPNDSNPLKDAVLHGSINSDGSLTYHSTSGSIDPKFNRMLESMFDQIANSNLMLGQTFKIGETVPIPFPISLPLEDVGAMNLAMEMRYTLKKIVHPLAYFDIEFDTVISGEQDLSDLSIQGGGSGKMIYHMESHISPEQNFIMTMAMKMPMHGGFLNLYMNNHSSTNTSFIQR